MSAGIEYNAWVLNQQGSPALFSATLSNRPAAGFTGRIFISTDTREIYRDTGVTWELIGSGGGSVNIYNSNGTLTGARTVTMAGNNILFSDSKNGSAAVSVQNLGTGGGTDASIQLISDAGTAAIGKRNVANSGFKIISAGNGYLYDNNSLAILADSATAQIKFSAGGASTAQMTLFSTGRLGLNTTVDAGFLADINGTLAIRNNATQFGSASTFTFGNGLVLDRDGGTTRIFNGGSIQYQSNITTAIQHNFINNAGFNNVSIVNVNSGTGTITATSGTVDTISVLGRKAATSGTASYNSLRIAQTVENAGTFTGIHRGIYYNPTLVNMASNDHYSFESTAGKIVVTNITTPSNTIQTTTAAFNHTYNIPAGASYSIGLQFGSTTALNYMIFAGSATFGVANIWAANSNFNQFNFSAPGSTVTVNQTTLRTISAISAQHQFYGTNSGTITHLSGLQVTGFYNANSGVITPVITNGYGVLINDLGDYGHTFTLVNRWGIYQGGTLDNNYFAGKLLVGTNTVTARQVHIAGDVEYTTTLSGTAGGSSGQHLNVWVNGNQYKIKLENP